MVIEEKDMLSFKDALPFRVTGVAMLFADAGYRTYDNPTRNLAFALVQSRSDRTRQVHSVEVDPTAPNIK
jgi:hypothetical protein